MPTSIIISIGTQQFLAGNTPAGWLFHELGILKDPQVAAEANPGQIVTQRQAIGHWQWIYGQRRVGGVVTFLEVTNNNNDLHMVITVAGHECEELGDIWFDEEVVPLEGSGNATGRYAGFVRIKKSKGDEAAATQPFPDLVAESAGLWTAAHRQTGRAKLYVRLQHNNDLFPNGIPNITCVAKGRKVLDPRTGLTAWSANAELCAADYMRNTAIGLSCTSDEVNEARTIAGANICDELVALAAGGDEARYTVNGAFSASGAPRETLASLLTSMDGHARFIGGTWHICPAAYATPTITLTADDLRGGLRVVPRLSRRELCNGVKGVHFNPDQNWQATDYPPVTNATYLDEDQDEPIWLERDRPFTTSAATCQRLGKIDLERNRQQITVEWAGKLTCYRLQPGNTVMVTLSRYGWSAKVFEVVAAKLAFEEAGGDGGGIVLGCDLVLRETASAVYDWSSGEETQVDPAPDTNLSDVFNVGVPGAPEVSEALYETRDGRGVAAKAIMRWAASADAFVKEYQPEHRTVGAESWTVQPRTEDLRAEILDIAPGRYDFRVKAINTVGVSSAYSTTSDLGIKGLTAAPGAPTGLSIQAGGGTARLKIAQAPELDVRRGGRVLVRFCHTGVTPAWESAFSIGEQDGYPGDATQLDVPLKPGTYLVKFQDSTGHESQGFSSIATVQASVLTFTTLSTVTFDPTFAGTHSGTVAVDGILTLGGIGLWDDIPDFDGVTNLDLYGGVSNDGTYTADTGLDLGSVKNLRLTSRLEGAVNNTLDLIDDRTGNVDSWLDWDGASFGGSAADAWMEVRDTIDDPAGAPTWKDWKRLDAAEFNARAFQFRARLTSRDPAYQPLVSVLRATAEEVV
jgi:hypothetical protein